MSNPGQLLNHKSLLTLSFLDALHFLPLLDKLVGIFRGSPLHTRIRPDLKLDAQLFKVCKYLCDRVRGHFHHVCIAQALELSLSSEARDN